MNTKYVDDQCACSDDESEETEDTSDETCTEEDSHDEEDGRMTYVRTANERARQDEKMINLDIRRLKKRMNRIVMKRKKEKRSKGQEI